MKMQKYISQIKFNSIFIFSIENAHLNNAANSSYYINQISLIFEMPHYPDEIEYSDKYQDDHYEYRHVLLPRDTYKKMPRTRLLNENEWRSLGVQQSRGWVHYELHKPEPHILLFRRPKGTDPQTGMPPTNFMAPSDNFLYV